MTATEAKNLLKWSSPLLDKARSLPGFENILSLVIDDLVPHKVIDEEMVNNLRDSAKNAIDANEVHAVTITNLQTDHAAALAAKDAGHEQTKAELLAENAQLREELAKLHSIMDLTDGGRELLRQKQIAELHAARETKAREHADLEAQLAELLSAATDTGG